MKDKQIVVLMFWITVVFCKKMDSKETTPYFQEMGGVTQHV